MPAPSLCVVSGVVYEVDGTPAVGVTLFLKRVLLNGVLIPTPPIGTATIPGPSGDHHVQYIEAITSIAGGVVSFTVPQLSTVYLEGNVSGYNNGEIALSIPATATSTLEALSPATFPIDVTTFTFLALVDTPDAFTGQALKNVRVNAAGTALEFSAPVVVDNETVQDALSAFFPDVAPFDWTYDDAGDRVTLAILDATASARGLMSTAYATKLDTFAAETGYALLAGRAGGQSLSGGNAASENLTLQSTAHATKGYILVGTGSLVGVNKSVPVSQLHTLSNAIGVIPLIAEGPAGQTANLVEFRVNGSSVFRVSAAGAVVSSSGATFPGTISGGAYTNGATSFFGFAGRSQIYSPANAILLLQNAALTDFDRLQFGGTTSSFPSLKRSTTELQARLADDSGDATLKGRLKVHANAVAETPTATHTLRLFDAAGTEYKVLCVAA